jgi:hypothetical protein
MLVAVVARLPEIVWTEGDAGDLPSAGRIFDVVASQ